MKGKTIILLTFSILALAVFSNAVWVPPTSAIYGEIFITNNTISITPASAEVFFNITTTTTPGLPVQAGKSQNVFINVTGVMDVQVPGNYKATWSISFQDGNNVDWAGGIGVGGVVQDNCRARRKLGASDTGNFGSSCILTLGPGDEITAMMANLDNTATVIVQEGGFNLIRLSS